MLRIILIASIIIFSIIHFFKVKFIYLTAFTTTVRMLVSSIGNLTS